MKYLVALRACLGAIAQGMVAGVYSMVLLLIAAAVVSPVLVQPPETPSSPDLLGGVLWLWLIGCGASWLLFMRRDILREAHRAIRKGGKRSNSSIHSK